MGVYIPNMEKPKHCTECYFVCRDQCELQDNSYDYDTFKEQKKHCPLQKIDLVKCEECEWSNGECSVGERYQGGCTFGERRSDEHR